MSVGEFWTKLDTGWLESACGMLFLRNDEGRFTVVPTPELRQSVMRRVVEVGLYLGGIVHPFAKVRVGESCRLEPADVFLLWLRCRSGEARVTVGVIPE